MNVQRHPPRGKYKLTVEDFLRLDESGVLGTDRTELLDGDIIIMNAEYRPHAWIAGELGYRLRRALEAIASDLYVMGASVALSEHDMPLPDIVLTREPLGDGPIPLASVAMIVEVAVSTLQRDIKKKSSIYARCGVPEYWIVDVASRTIRCCSDPVAARYRREERFAFGDLARSITMPELAVATDSL